MARRVCLVGILLAALCAAAIGGLMTWHHEVQIYGDASMQGELIGCTTTAEIDCDVVNTSDYSELLGVPIAAWGIANYLTLAGLAGLALRGRAGLLPIIASIGLLNAGYSVLLYWVSITQVGSLCAWCMRLYGISALVPILAFAGGAHRDTRPTIGDLGRLVLGFAALASVVVIGQRQLRGWLLGDAADLVVPEVTERADEAPELDPEGPAPELAVNITTEDKNPAVLVLEPDDAWRGSPDATVAVVEFADLECGYCKRASGQLHALYEAYGDRVLFVFKHFPMDPACNPGVRNRKHRRACLAAQAATCAQDQRRFWAFHDIAFKNQHQLEADQLRNYAGKAGVDLAAWDACMASGETTARVVADGEMGKAIDVHGTPRIFIGERLYRSGHSTKQMARALELALGAAPKDAAVAASALGSTRVPVKPIPADVPPMQAVAFDDLSFEIDTFEAALDEAGAARSGKHEIPALQMSWFAARDACAAAGKRLCSQEEWVAACQGARPVDDDGDGFTGDDMIEGTAYPYGDYHEPGRCWDGRDREKHRPVYTGELPGCVGAAGVYDLTGNVEEWVGTTPETAILMGGAFDTSKDHARCFRSNDTFGPGFANRRTGFRCCSGR